MDAYCNRKDDFFSSFSSSPGEVLHHDLNTKEFEKNYEFIDEN
jgi:hypothetical protein